MSNYISQSVVNVRLRPLAKLLAAAIVALAAPLQAQQGSQQFVERFEDGSADAGAPLYKRYCRGCHGADGRGGAHTFMPHIENLTKKGYIELLPDSYLYTVIAEGGKAVGKSSYMPAWQSKLSQQEVKDIIKYVRSLPTY